MFKPKSVPHYFGTKNWHKAKGVAKWIHSIVPYERETSYVEPYAGMCAILVNRPRCTIEIASDLNGRITNWWKAVRDCPDEMLYRIMWTPHSESLHNESFETIDEGDPLERAVKFYTVIRGSRLFADGHAGHVFRVGVTPNKSHRFPLDNAFKADLHWIADRLQGVQLLDRPAIDILRRMENVDKAVIYCDPPYASATTSAYGVCEIDKEATLETLRKQKGRVVISGYGEEWDELGWQKHTHESLTTLNPKLHPKRTEVLWTNFEAGSQLYMLGDYDDEAL